MSESNVDWRAVACDLTVALENRTRENAALREAGYILAMLALQSEGYGALEDDEKAAVEAFLPKSLKAVTAADVRGILCDEPGEGKQGKP